MNVVKNGTAIGAVSNGARSNAAIEVRDVSKLYDTRSGSIQALDRIALTVNTGEFVSLLGPSGCGKSTLLRIVAGLEKVTSGEVSISGSPVTGPQTQLGIVFQSPLLLAWRDAIGNILLQAEARKMDLIRTRQTSLALMESVGLGGFEHKLPRELSGGMQQRVAICRALLHDPSLILMDEPFGALDALTRDQMNIDLQALWRRGEKTVLFVTHSISEAVFLSDRILVVSPRPGRIVLDQRINLPRPRRMRMRDLEEFTGYQKLIRARFAESGVLREDDE
jgi:NitT/TauT family transport system ATP-binding protein